MWSLDGILFDRGTDDPARFEDLQAISDYSIPSAQQTFTRTRMFVPPEVLGGVKSSLSKLETVQ